MASIGLRDPVPALVAVHGVVAAGDGGDADAFGQARPAGAPGRRRADCGGVSRPSVKAWTRDRDAGVVQHAGQRGGMVLVRMDAAGRDAGPIRWQVPPEAFSASTSCDERRRLGDASRPRSPSSIRGSSCITTRPAPMFRWPTSELPICPSGSPTSRPEVRRKACGQVAHSAVEGRRAGLAHGVVGDFLAPAPAVEDDEHDGAGCGHGILERCGIMALTPRSGRAQGAGPPEWPSRAIAIGRT